MLLGISTHSVSEAEKAAADGADYVAIGSVFPTGTKENLEAVVGLRMIGEVKSAVGETPLIAIGGINAANAGEVIRAGADGVAVASAVISADDPGSAARELKEIVRIELDRRETAR
jgi:thiamine-phosphate pyrophosphorylase